MRYADKKGIKLAIIADDTEFERDLVTLKEMASGIQHDIPLQDLEQRVSALLERR